MLRRKEGRRVPVGWSGRRT